MSAFSESLPLHQLRDGLRLDLAADEAERAAIAARLDLASLERLEAHVALERQGDQVRAHGRLRGALEQRCVATDEPLPVHVDEPFDLKFVPEPGAAAEGEIDLSDEDCDVVFHDGAAIDLGAALADTLALSLDPYPRSPNADEALREAGVLSEEQAGPFAALAALKKG
ncbi:MULTISPECIES: YceD family protein [Sphingomonas]|uniref:YceD family protein n=1 Tax=Sphingomonas TaxID=13687 RepID=UPI001F0843E7|nr:MULTISPECIES: DUF177 domain-containing protein [Sphingomonas]